VAEKFMPTDLIHRIGIAAPVEIEHLNILAVKDPNDQQSTNLRL